MEAKKIALEILEEVLKRIDPYSILKGSCSYTEETRLLKIFDREFKLCGNVYVISIGKAACSMAKAIEEILGNAIKDGIAITKYGYATPLRKIRVIEAGHPIPDENSLKGALTALEIAKEAKKDDLVIVLISGGGSSVLEKPREGLTLEDIKIVTRLLLESGASIHEINIVRRHLSEVKGGGLLKALYPAKVVSVVLSDVVGDQLEDIASGPTAVDPTTFKDALNVLEKYGLTNKVPENVVKLIQRGIDGELDETLKSYEGYDIHNIVIGGDFLAKVTAEVSKKFGLKAYILSTEIEGEAWSWGMIFGSIVKEVKLRNRPFTPPCVLIATGEVTVTLRENYGLGGPNQEVVLASSLKLDGIKDVALLSVDTDGTDGFTDAAGAIADGSLLNKLKELGIDIKEILLKHDAYNALKKVKALIKTGPTRTNLNDLYLAIIL